MLGHLALGWRVGHVCFQETEKRQQITEAVSGLLRSQGSLPLSSTSLWPSLPSFSFNVVIVPILWAVPW